MSEYRNGAAPDEAPAPAARGRRAPAYPTTVLPNSGYEVQVRRLAAGVPVELRAVAYRELLSERPQPPAQEVETAPGETRLVERPSDPDYLEALRAWDTRVRNLAGQKLIALVRDYALLTPTDPDAVADFRAAMAAVGRELPLSDREVFVWEILAPTDADQGHLLAFVLGLSEAAEEAVRAHKATFRGDVPGKAAGALADPPREGQQ